MIPNSPISLILFKLVDNLDSLKVVEKLTPSDPGPNQVLLEMKAASLNYRDLMQVKGASCFGMLRGGACGCRGTPCSAIA